MISPKLKSIILQELALEDFPIDASTTADMIPGWDSLSHARILAAVEDAFRIRFKTLEIIRIRNVGELQKLVDFKIQP